MEGWRGENRGGREGGREGRGEKSMHESQWYIVIVGVPCCGLCHLWNHHQIKTFLVDKELASHQIH